jgi:hypothetical protein|tara:strand:- start:174 stop:437 length:264 start_codon:yes stop_codon:yes gene_type:complete
MDVMIKQVESEGLKALMGETVTLFCGVYIYSGTLVGINDSCVKLEDAGIVYETGSFTEKKWKDKQNIPSGVWYVTTQSIESFGVLKK